MKASPLPAALLSLTMLAGIFLASGVAADKVMKKNGQTLEGQVLGTKAGSLQFKMGGGSTSIPLKDVKQLSMQDPPEFTAAAAQLSRGDAKGALAALEKINQNYSGLPAAWAERAAVMLGDAKLAVGDTAGAKAAYDQFVKTYPGSVALANLGMARLAVESGDIDGATAILAPLTAKASETALPAAADGAALSQAFFLLGRIDEAREDKAGALENYLKASALFPFDQNAVAEAKKRAEALRAENPGLITP